jgi:hypothetical protein
MPAYTSILRSPNQGTYTNLLKVMVVKPEKVTKLVWQAKRLSSLLTTFSKVLEKVMYSRLSQHMHYHNILVPEQSGFRKGISTQDVAYQLRDNVLKAVKQKMHVGEIFCD